MIILILLAFAVLGYQVNKKGLDSNEGTAAIVGLIAVLLIFGIVPGVVSAFVMASGYNLRRMLK
jgi:hypothetical protein